MTSGQFSCVRTPHVVYTAAALTGDAGLHQAAAPAVIPNTAGRQTII